MPPFWSSDDGGHAPHHLIARSAYRSQPGFAQPDPSAVVGCYNKRSIGQGQPATPIRSRRHGGTRTRTSGIEAYHDMRLTQALVLQPRVEFNLAAQDVARDQIGTGFTDVDLGLRLRYEVVPEFTPYVGVAWESKLGGTADRARAAGEDVSAVSLRLSIRAWF